MMRFDALLALGIVILIAATGATDDVSTTEIALLTTDTDRAVGPLATSSKSSGIRKKLRKVKRRKMTVAGTPNGNSTVLKKRRKIRRRKHKKTSGTSNSTLVEIPGVIPLKTNLQRIVNLPISIQKFPETTISAPTVLPVGTPKSKLCTGKNGGCSQICDESHGKTRCSCFEGFSLSKDGKTCEDVDECLSGAANCSASCGNTPGSYECSCPPGYRLADDGRSCDDVDECLLRNGHGLCQDACANVPGSYSCSCGNLPGATLNRDGRTCDDVDECAAANGGCSHVCIDAFGRAFCACPDGFSLGPDWRTCHDINECEERTCDGACLNTEGSYRCLSHRDLQDDRPVATRDTTTCRPLFPPAVGYVSCSKTRDSRNRLVNAPGTTCSLVCPQGFKLSGSYRLVCGGVGKWSGKKRGRCVRRKDVEDVV